MFLFIKKHYALFHYSLIYECGLSYASYMNLSLNVITSCLIGWDSRWVYWSLLWRRSYCICQNHLFLVLFHFFCLRCTAGFCFGAITVFPCICHVSLIRNLEVILTQPLHCMLMLNLTLYLLNIAKITSIVSHSVLEIVIRAFSFILHLC